MTISTTLVFGLDPGFASFGFSLVRLSSTGHAAVEELGVIETQKASKKHAVYASDDTLHRARDIYKRLKPLAARCSAMAAESMSFPRSSSVANKMGVSWGLIASLSSEFGLPVVQFSPQKLKEFITNDKAASKEAMEAAVKDRLGVDFANKLHILRKTAREHPVDATAAALCSVESEVVKALLRGPR